MVEALRGSKCQVSFTKKNGEERVMSCTLNLKAVPPEDLPKSLDSDTSNDSEKEVNLDVIKVYDLEKMAWRSFRVDSVTDFFAVAEV
jgi:hypothetical protein